MLRWNLDVAVGGMSVGDSFFVPCVDCQPVITTLVQLGKAFGYKVVVRIRYENYIKGVRIWRMR